MKNLFYILIFSFTFLSYVQAQDRPEIRVRTAGERPIYWLHGLGGSQYSWDKVSTAVQLGTTGFAAREVQGLKPTYGPNSLSSAALDLEVEMKTFDGALDYNNNGFPIAKNMIIAHSQGGLVARRLDQIFNSPTDPDRRFGGLVTFGTPHGGAYILNSVRNDDHQDFIAEACDAVMSGTIADKSCNFFVWLLGTEERIDLVKDIICEDFAVFAVEQFLDDYTTPITDDYYVGAPVLQSLNNYSHPYLEKVAFYSEEDDPVFWRLIYNLFNEPNDFPAFGANYDDQIVDEAGLNMYRAYGQANIWEYRADDHPLGNFYCGNFFSQGKMYDISDAYTVTGNWWENANEKWEFLIGAKDIQNVYQGYCTCIIRTPEGYLDGVTYTESNPANCVNYESLPDHEECYPTYGLQTVSYDSDGVVEEGSARDFPGATQVQLLGSNHQQMRNDENTKEGLSDLFSGFHGTYFATPVR